MATEPPALEHRPASPGQGSRSGGLALLAIMLALGTASIEAADLRLRWRFTHAGSEASLDSLRYPLSSGEEVSYSRVSLLASSFAVQREDGVWVEVPNEFAWIDIGAGRLAHTLSGLPEGRYQALRFDIGVPPKENTADPASWPAAHPLNPALNNLHWNWQGGYIFLAIEGRCRSANGVLSGYSYHFAREPYRTCVVVSGNLILQDAAPAGAALAFDLGALLNMPRAISPAKDGTSTHSRDGDPLAEKLRANLPGAFQLSQETSPATQAAAVPRPKPIDLPPTYTPYPLRVAAHFPAPALPLDNPLLRERVELGRALFTETRLSRDNSLSCASCHEADHAFADPRALSLGVDGLPGHRNAMPLLNLAWKNAFFWDGRARTLREQVLIPMADPLEMDQPAAKGAEKLGADDGLKARFKAAFGTEEITPARIALALENFLLTLTSHDAKVDRVLRGKETFTAEEQRGFELFFTEYEPRSGPTGADCFHCHGGTLFTDNQFHDNGVPNRGDRGRAAVSGREADAHRFQTPSLRNVAVTAPYMHDGSLDTLEQVVGHYNRHVFRSPTLAANLAKHPESGLGLSREDERALVAFLRTLTDSSLKASEPPPRPPRRPPPPPP